MKKVIVLTVALLVTTPVVASAQHIVKPGETMSGIAAQYGMSLEQLEHLNPHIEYMDWIYPNQHINVKSGLLAEDIIGYARSLQDITDYEYGGQNAPYVTDCSGWVQHVYKEFGIDLPRVSAQQAKVGTPITFEEIEKGDLLFFGDHAQITHVGIYIGDGLWISNLNADKNVEILSVWGSWSYPRFLWAQRVI